ncbi:MAG: transcriptional repressor [Armatimonadetes bacterium]|nr:transcriptional repressor [Armatimonadota bacterium]
METTVKVKFWEFLREQGLRQTAQREAILDLFLDSGGHISPESLFNTVKRAHPHIGYSTVYRTLKLLAQSGLAQEVHFHEDQTLYDRKSEQHDHLVCVRCGRVVEFQFESVERLQSEIARQQGFLPQRRKFEIYGLCRECQQRTA